MKREAPAEESGRVTRAQKAQRVAQKRAGSKIVDSSGADSGSSSTVAALFDAAAADYFKVQKQGGKGIRKEIHEASREESVRLLLDSHAYGKYYDSLPETDPMYPSYPTTVPEHLAVDWLWLTTTNTNLLVYGVGDKSCVVNDFWQHYLKGEDVVLLDGNPNPRQLPSEYATNTYTSWVRNILAVLDLVAEDILHWKQSSVYRQDPVSYAHELCSRLDIHYGRVTAIPSSTTTTTATATATATAAAMTDGSHSASVLPSARTGDSLTAAERRLRTMQMNKAVPRYGGRYAHTQPRLYVVIHELCGPAFASHDAQTVLSILASCKSVSVLATVDFLNVTQLWDTLTITRFAWSYYSWPTYVHHRLPSDHCLLTNTDRSALRHSVATGLLGASRVDTILESLPVHHKEFLCILCRKVVEKRQKFKGKSRRGGQLRPVEDPCCVSTEEAAREAIQKMVVRSKADLLGICKNFFEHRILEDVRSEQAGDFLRVVLSDSYIESLSSTHK